ncbi:MAG: DUF4956 domain-containing protein [Bacteroidetes bacterium]|nr:MAG: DUF4956 domain-containing protein [Bacteroidota bacterium]
MDKTPSFQDFLANQPLEISLWSFCLHLLLAGLLGFVLAWVYRRFGTALTNRQQFSYLFPMLTMTTMVIISFVKSSLALSLGLVGALSIVRFRAAIKEPEELMYLFLCIAIGLGLGAGQLGASLLAFGIIGLVLAGRGLLHQKQQTAQLLLSIRSTQAQHPSLQQLLDTLDPHCQAISLKRMDQNAREHEATFVVQLTSPAALSEAQASLLARWPNLQLTFLDTKMLT